MNPRSPYVDVLSVELDRILKGPLIQSLFQPLVDVTHGTVFGYEALSRGPSDSPLHGAQMLFDTAERYQLTTELESVCLESSARQWNALGCPGRLFVNVSPERLTPSREKRLQFLALLRRYDVNPERIVIELSERYRAARPEVMKKSLSWLKEQGFRIAIDDLGAGYSGLKLWSDIRPDFVKIDRHFIRGINDDLVKKQFVQSLVELADRLGCEVIAEGVETQVELEHIRELNVHLVQGFLFGRPALRARADLSPLALERTTPKSARWSAESLSEYVEPVPPSMLLAEAWERMQQKPDMFSLPVVDAGRPLGLLHRWHILETYSTPYGRALFDRQPVTRLMSAQAMMVEADLSVEEVSQRLVDDDVYYLKQHFIVVRKGQYLGLGTSRKVLQDMTTQRLENARHANPLTSLPGNVIIERHLERAARARQPVTLIYFDINHFKPLNDTLGYRVGDRLIIRLADLLRERFRHPTDFIGHVGGDDFVVVTSSGDAHAQVLSVCKRFAAAAQGLYPVGVRQAGEVKGHDRQGQPATFPLASLAAGMLSVAPGEGLTADQMADQLANAKTEAKLSAGSVYELKAGSDSA